MKRAIIDLETGELLMELKETDRVLSKKDNKKLEQITPEEFKNFSVQDVSNIYKALKSSREINKYGFIKLSGSLWFNYKALGWALERNMSKEFALLCTKMSLKNYIKMKGAETQTHECSNWTQLFESIGITNGQRKVAFKKFILEYDIIRQANKFNSREKVLVINPTIIRNGSHVSAVSLAVFKDLCIKDIHKYSSFLLFANGMIEYEDIDF
jgi:hypothetical protein